MKIAIMRRGSITSLDGVNRFCAYLAEGLRKLGHEVFIASWGFYGVERENLSKYFAEVHGLEEEIPVYTIEEKPRHGGPWAEILFDWWFKGSRLLKELGADVVVMNGVAPLRFKPKVAVAHGPLGRVSRLKRPILKALYGMYDYVVCVSKASEEEYKGITRCSEIIPLPFKTSLYMPKPLEYRSNIVVHVGTAPRKNPQVSVEAVRILRERGLDVKFVFVGARNNLIEEFARRYSFVEPLFSVDERTKAELLSRAKVLILPSSGEALPYTTLEAMASGTPPVVSSAVPSDVVIDEFNGVRVDSLNPVDYANALEKLLREEDLWLKLSRNGTEFVKRFDQVEVARRYEDVFRRLLHES
ncbi:MAG: mannosyltransferase [Zestosphaera tikiterensis]|uniref:Mannosyltransferase n=1 Tax=Zestosphaera tikiterensis TaxID=1973259 RepID=A0A2R7Y245_9CREN|nr:MAG: mannosyltransferase [Zestosphaera tikiterensis]